MSFLILDFRYSNNSFDHFAATMQQQQPHHPQLNHGFNGGLDFFSSNLNNGHLDKRGNSGMNPSWQGNKDLQEGLRALLPNVNVSFGNLPGNGGSGSGLGNSNFPDPGRRPPGPPGGLGLPSFPPSREDQEQQQSQQQRNGGGWNGLGGNDWTMLDPAIVGGQLSNHHPRSESPSSWIKSTLDLGGSNSGGGGNPLENHPFLPKGPSLLPGFANMSLSSNSGSGGRLWNHGGPSGSAQQPPPGFGGVPQQLPTSQNLPPFGGQGQSNENQKKDFFTLA